MIPLTILVCVCVCVCVCAQSLSHVWLFGTPGTGLLGSSVHGILQARKLEWVAMPSSRGSSQPRFLASPALAGRFFTTVPPGKPLLSLLRSHLFIFVFIFINLGCELKKIVSSSVIFLLSYSFNHLNLECKKNCFMLNFSPKLYKIQYFFCFF